MLLRGVPSGNSQWSFDPKRSATCFSMCLFKQAICTASCGAYDGHQPVITVSGKVPLRQYLCCVYECDFMFVVVLRIVFASERVELWIIVLLSIPLCFVRGSWWLEMFSKSYVLYLSHCPRHQGYWMWSLYVCRPYSLGVTVDMVPEPLDHFNSIYIPIEEGKRHGS